MTIRIKDYKIIQSEYGFDLIKMVKSKRIGTGTMSAPNGEDYERSDDMGYFTNLENCVHQIILLSLLDIDEQVSLEKFVNEYKGLKEEIANILKNE